jgi:hypothetical protein
MAAAVRDLALHSLADDHLVLEGDEALTAPGPALELHVLQDAESGAANRLVGGRRREVARGGPSRYSVRRACETEYRVTNTAPASSIQVAGASPSMVPAGRPLHDPDRNPKRGESGRRVSRQLLDSGERGIRTPDALAGTSGYQPDAFDHSAISGNRFFRLSETVEHHSMIGRAGRPSNVAQLVDHWWRQNTSGHWRMTVRFGARDRRPRSL